MSDLTFEPAEDAAARAERRLALLEEMAEIGMKLLRALPSYGAADPNDSAEAFARISRAVRLTLALEEKTDRFLAELKAGELRELQESASADPAPDPFPGLEAAIRDRKANALDLLVAVSESEGESLESFEKLLDSLAETIDEAEANVSQELPLGPMLESVCHRMGLGPELSAKVAEGWSCGYLASRPRFNPWGEPTWRADYKRPAPQLE